MLLLVRARAPVWFSPTRSLGLTALAEKAVQPLEKPEPIKSADPQAPVLRKCELQVPTHRRPVQAWVESLRGYEQERVGLAELHPDVFSVAPRLDILHQVAIWQKNFKRISYAKTKTRAEVRGGGRKPWPQKGSGRARHGSIRSPIWRGAYLELGQQDLDPHPSLPTCRERSDNCPLFTICPAAASSGLGLSSDYDNSLLWPSLPSLLLWPMLDTATRGIFLNLPAPAAFAWRSFPWHSRHWWVQTDLLHMSSSHPFCPDSTNSESCAICLANCLSFCCV
ncbi:large ribosomal subunit protein uL4m isoform X2 [Saccopteryx bilineata]|uniref:large ribosomal subunit protein uL4m isoform X2 n=1 Tax=Saccopteryx bilineata TaxID=59482 RepID=UPI0033907503